MQSPPNAQNRMIPPHQTPLEDSQTWKAKLMWTATTINQLRELRANLSGPVAFVPTMGALHEGHASLMTLAKREYQHVLVSIFVNPTQFGPGEDYDLYPRSVEADLDLCERAGVTGVFCPRAEDIYPLGTWPCEVAVPTLAAELEGAFRPGHFNGVCRVVLKLFNLIQPHAACFGTKDYQQLRVIQAMTQDLFLPIRIIPCPTRRDPDGLALSSRNRFLDPQQRRRALGLFKALSEAKALVEQAEETNPAAVESAMKQVLDAHRVQPDYAVVRHPRSLAPIDCIEPALTGGVVALIAARVDHVRLIDNMLLALPETSTSESVSPEP